MKNKNKRSKYIRSTKRRRQTKNNKKSKFIKFVEYIKKKDKIIKLEGLFADLCCIHFINPIVKKEVRKARRQNKSVSYIIFLSFIFPFFYVYEVHVVDFKVDGLCGNGRFYNARTGGVSFWIS
jgi:hypothetical protein